MVVNKNTAGGSTKKEKVSGIGRVPPYSDSFKHARITKENFLDFHGAAACKPLSDIGEMVKKFSIAMIEKYGDEITTSDEVDWFDKEIDKWLKDSGKKIIMKKGKPTVIDDLKIDIGHLPKKDINKQIGFSIDKESQQEIASAEMDLCFATVDAFAKGMSKLKKYSKYSMNKIKTGIFLAIPQSKGIAAIHLANHLGVSNAQVHYYRFSSEAEDVRKYILKKYTLGFTPSVLDALIQAATQQGAFGGYNVQAMKLYLEYVEGWKPGVEIDQNVKGGFTVVMGADSSQFINPEDDDKKNDDEDDEYAEIDGADEYDESEE